MILRTNSPAGDLWAITSYFNPMRYSRRLANFKTFRGHLNVPLVAVELAYGADYELQDHDAEILIRLRGDAILWQKERLLNLALQALPGHCCKVAWVNCDMIFARADWAERASSLLERFMCIQLYDRLHNLSATWRPLQPFMDAVETTRPSAAFSIAAGVPPAICLAQTANERIGTSAPGLAWAARRELLTEHCFYDAFILGGGDRAVACAAHNCMEELLERYDMNERQRDHYLGWAKAILPGG
jgi:hypothetical protein